MASSLETSAWSRLYVPLSTWNPSPAWFIGYSPPAMRSSQDAAAQALCRPRWGQRRTCTRSERLQAFRNYARQCHANRLNVDLAETFRSAVFKLARDVFRAVGSYS